jgi:LPS-assembly protein
MTRTLRVLTLLVAIAGPGARAAAQVNIAGFERVVAYSQEKLGDKHFQLSGAVELERPDMSIYADNVEFFEDQDKAVMTGNVVVTQGANRIAADRAEFNTRTQLGTFYRASGIASVRQGPQRPAGPGGIAVPPPVGPQENDVYYFGETVEKLGPKKYRITNGGFSTCVQPTPRWDLTADSIVLNIDHYTLLRQMLLNVKGVPMLYLPIMYYPTKEDERATGFLIPTYGLSRLRGNSIHNAFFWAIDRSQDATFMADWYSKTGTGTGGEYRYNRGAGSDGQMTAYMLNEHEAVYAQSSGGSITQPAARSYTVRGMMNQGLPARFRARAQVDYFSSVVSNQTFNTDVYNAGTNRRTFGANVVGSYSGFFLNGTYDRTEAFYNTTSSALVGSSPRISFTRTERPLTRNSPIYFGANGEFAHLDRQTKNDGAIVDDRGLGRFDVTPQIRYPFKRWPFMTINTSASFRETYYTRSQDPTQETRPVIDVGLNRSYFTVATQVVGPTFTRVWNTPDNGYAEKFKHTIEPVFTVQRTSNIDVVDRVVVIDGVDTAYGGTTSYSYGLNNRFYAKRKTGQVSIAQEILALEITQSYYSNANASRYDPRYSSSLTGAAPSKFSPIAINLRAIPSPTINATVRAEVDSRYRELRTISANGSLNWRQQIQTTVGWTKKFFIPELEYFNDPRFLDHYLNVQSNVQTRDRKYGAIYSMNYDIQHSALLQQRISGFYNAQCCGIAFEYQTWSFAGIPAYVLPSDHRFFLSFTLAGLGNFSPFSGGLSGTPR